MKVTFSAVHFEPTEKLQVFAVNELSRLERYFDGEISGEIILKQEGTLKVVEMRLNALGKVLPAKLQGKDFYKMLPKAVEKLETQLKAHKSKVYNR